MLFLSWLIKAVLCFSNLFLFYLSYVSIVQTEVEYEKGTIGILYISLIVNGATFVYIIFK